MRERLPPILRSKKFEHILQIAKEPTPYIKFKI